MKILFVTDLVHSNNDPNINLVKNISDIISGEHDIYFMGHSSTGLENTEFCFIYNLDEKVRNLYFSLNKLCVPKKILKLLSHPILSFFGLVKVFNVDLIAIKYAKEIKKLHNKYNFDVVISVSAPFYTAKGLVKSKISAKKIIMMFDPYADHHIFKNNRTKKQQEKCFEKSDYVFMPTLLKNEYSDDKIKGFEFPALVFSKEIEKNLYKEDDINLAFVGSLYSDIRSPEFLYELIKKLDIPNLKVTIVGGIYGEFSDEFNNKYCDLIKEKINIIGRVDKNLAHEYMKKADVLVNIGNTVENMLPSKVIEYISTGNPVINISQIKNSPEESYFNNYGNAINIFSKKEITTKDINNIKEFILNRKIIHKKEILEKFNNCTPEFVANQLLDELERGNK